MARKNRVVLKYAVYDITSRVAHRELLFADDAFKDRIAGWIQGVADFSGVEVYAWSIMDNHFHLLVHVPRVPREYWIDPLDEPDSQAFGMRPAECHVPRLPHVAWDSPRGEDFADGDSPHGDGAARPAVGFELSDEDMLGRLLSLYGDERRIDRLRRAWRPCARRAMAARSTPSRNATRGGCTTSRSSSRLSRSSSRWSTTANAGTRRFGSGLLI